MKRSEHYIDLAGPGCHGKLVRLGAVGTVLRCVEPAARDTVRMSALHSSRMVGRPWKELSKAWDIRYAGHTRSPDGQCYAKSSVVPTSKGMRTAESV